MAMWKNQGPRKLTTFSEIPGSQFSIDYLNLLILSLIQKTLFTNLSFIISKVNFSLVLFHFCPLVTAYTTFSLLWEAPKTFYIFKHGHVIMAIIYETNNFILESHERLEIDRLEGGHMKISPKVDIED